MADQHPITPPPELVEQWRTSWHHAHGEFRAYLATQAARWGADQELAACCELLDLETEQEIRAARRPKPPSLKEQALKELAWVDKHLNMPLANHCTAIHTIRAALDQLP